MWILLIQASAQTPEPAETTEAWPSLPAAPLAVEHHGDTAESALRAASAQRYVQLMEEKLAGRWFAALVSLDPNRLNAIDGRFQTRRGFFEFIENEGALVEVWTYAADGQLEDGVLGRRLTALEVADLHQNAPDTPTFVTVTFRDRSTGIVRRCRAEFGFQTAGEALVRSLAYQQSRNLQLTARRILSTRDANQRLSAPVQWDALDRAAQDGSFPLDPMSDRPTDSKNLFVAFEFAVDDSSNFARVLHAYREDDVEREIANDQTRLWLRRPDGTRVSALAFRRTPLGDGLEPAPHPLTGREFVELRVENPKETDPRRWNIVEFGEPEVLQQLSLARFGLINAHLEHRRKVLDLKRANLDMIFMPIFAGLNIGGGVSGVGFPLGAGAQLGYNVLTGPHFVPKVPTAEEMRELFMLLAARQRNPALRLKPDQFLTRSDLDTLRADFSKLTDAQVRETLEGLNDSDLNAMLALARQAGMDAKYSLLVNVLSGAAVVSGKADSGVMRDLFNNPYFALNGDVYINYIIAAAVGAKELTPASGVSLYNLVRGEGPAKAWAQYIGVSFDIRAFLNSVSRLRFESLADKELRMPFPYATRMRDLAAYEIRIFGYPLLLFYKRGLLKDDLKAYNNDFAYGMIGRRIVVHFPTRESMEAQVQSGHMIPLGYVKVSDGKGGLRNSNLAVFAYRIPDGPHRGSTAMILYGLKAYADYSATIDREVTRFREFERGLEEGMVIEQLIEADDASALSAADYEPRIIRGEDAVSQQFVGLLAPLVEWRRHLQRRELGLAPVPSEAEGLKAVQRQLFVRGVIAEDSKPDPLLGLEMEGSSFRYAATVNGHRRVLQVTAIASLDRLGKDAHQIQDGAAVESARRAGVAPGGAGIAFLNTVRDRGGRLELGPLIRNAAGSVMDAGIRTSAAGLEPILAALDRLPLTHRARLEHDHFAAVVLDIDADGDGGTERVALSMEFPPGEIRRRRTDPLTGLEEVVVHDHGRQIETVTERRIVHMDHDELGRETQTSTFDNTGSLSEPRKGALLEQTQTLETWAPTGDAAWKDPQAARIRRLRLIRVTGDWTVETFGLFPLPVEVVAEAGITTNQFDAYGRLQRAVTVANLTASGAASQSPPDAVLHPTPGPVRFESTIQDQTQDRTGVTLTLDRRDIVTGQRSVQRRNLARYGRIESEEITDPFDGTRTFKDSIVREYHDQFLFGQVPRRMVTTSSTGRPHSEGRILSVNPITREMLAVETDYTGATRTNLWVARWDRPVRVETALRTTTQQTDIQGLEVSGSTRTRDTGEEVSRFAGQFDVARRLWILRRDVLFQPGITNRTETNIYSPGGRLVRSRTANVLETRMVYDADGLVQSNLVWYADATTGAFDRMVRAERDFRWSNGSRDARVQTWLEGTLHDEFRSITDVEGRVIVDGLRTFPGLNISTHILHEGATERVRQADEQMGVDEGIWGTRLGTTTRTLRTVRVPGAPRRLDDGTTLLPITVAPSWGLVSTQMMVIGDPLGRARETLYEDGRRGEVTEWFAGSAVPRVSRILRRDGSVAERYSLSPSLDTEGGALLDRVTRTHVGSWTNEFYTGTAVAESALLRGTGIALYADTAEGRTFFDLTEPFATPRYVVDPSGRSGVPVQIGRSVVEHVWSVSRAVRSTATDGTAEPVLSVDTVNLLPTFQPVRTRTLLDRAGKVLEARVQRLANPGAAGFVASALLDARPATSDHFTFRYRYAPLWWSNQTDNLFGRERVLTNQPPTSDANAVAVNLPPWREVATSILGTAGSGAGVGSISRLGSGGIATSTADNPRELETNPYMPDEPGSWISWTTVGRGSAGGIMLQAEDIYNERGQLAVRRIQKETEDGAPAVKLVYQLPSPAEAVWESVEQADNRWSVTLANGSGIGKSDDDFLYFYTRSTNSSVPTLRFQDARGVRVDVGTKNQEAGVQSISFWPLSPLLTQWLPDDVSPEQASTVTGPPWLPPGETAYAVSVSELVQAGLNWSQLNKITLSSTQPLQTTTVRSLRRRAAPLLPRHPPELLWEAQASPHDFVRIVGTPIHRSPSASAAGEGVSTIVQRNRRPLAVTQPAVRKSPFPDIVVVATGDTGTPRPLYRLSSFDGHFQQRFETLSQGEMVQVYSVVQGFELPRLEVFDPRVLGDEVSPALLAYGYDYHARVSMSKGAGLLGRPLAVLRNRIAANPYHYAGERLWDSIAGPFPNQPSASRFSYGLLHHSRLQANAIQRLPSLAEAILPTRSLPWSGTLTLPPGPLAIDLPSVAATLRELHVHRFSTNLTRGEPPTYLIPTMPDTVAERYVDTVSEGAIVALAIKVGASDVARAVLEFYWNKTDGGQEPVQSSYDGVSGTALARELAFKRPVQARPTAAAQLAIAAAAIDLADATTDPRWEAFADDLVSGLLNRFRSKSREPGPRGISAHESLEIESALGLVFWPDAARFPVAVNIQAFALLERLAGRPRMMPAGSDLAGFLTAARAEQRAWLERSLVPEVIRTGVVPSAWFEIQDIYGETTALAPERWTSPEAWLAWIEIADRFGATPEQTRSWLDNLARAHGATVDGVWGLDWSLPLLRSEAVSPELTARFLRVATSVGHTNAAALAHHSLSQWLTPVGFPTVRTALTGQALKTEQGTVLYPRTDGAGWPQSFGVAHQMTAGQAAPAATNAPAPLPKRLSDSPARSGRTDLTAFIVLAALYYGGIILVTLGWWRFRHLRERRNLAEEDPSLVPEPVLRRAEERWGARVLGIRSPDGAPCTRFSNASVEQNFLMQLRAIYKLVMEWRRRENNWDPEDVRLVEDGSDAWLNGLDEFSSVLGIYLRFVIKAGAKDGFDHPNMFDGSEDSNHLWARMVMYLSEHYCTLLTLLRSYEALTTDAERAMFEWKFTEALSALGVRQRPEAFDARSLFDLPVNPKALDLMVIQRPGATLESVMKEVAVRLGIPLTHILLIVENYRAWKRRESPVPTHPYLIEAAKIIPNFALTGLGALIWYNQSIRDSPVIPYLGSLVTGFALSPESLLWSVPLLAALVLGGAARFVRTYRFENTLLPRAATTMILDSTMTMFLKRPRNASQGIRQGWLWNPELYERIGWLCRVTGYLILAITLFQLETPSFVSFLIVKGILAMLVVTEIAGVVLPLAVSMLSLAVQDVAARNPSNRWAAFLNQLNLTATRPASPLWLSVRYHLRPSVPSGDRASLAQAIILYLALNFAFIAIGAYLCQQILPLWFTDAYLNAASWKLVLGGFVFWNTLYLLRYGLFLLATAIAAAVATFPLRSLAAAAALALVFLAIFSPEVTWGPVAHEKRAWAGALVMVVLAIYETPILRTLRRVTRRSTPVAAVAQANPPTADSSGSGIGIVYMSGDDLSSLKLTSAVLMSRWHILRDQLGSTGIQLLHQLTGQRDDAALEQMFSQLRQLEERHGVTLWHPRQLVLDGEAPSIPSELGLHLVVKDEEHRREVVTAWDARRWLVTMMSTAGHSQDTAINLVDIALRLEREGLASRTVFYLIQNKYDNRDDNRPSQLSYTEGELGQRDKLSRLLRALAPGCRAWSVQNWTPFGFKSAGMTGMDLVPEETMGLGTMVVLDRNATVNDLDAFTCDLRSAMADPDLIIVIPGRGTSNTLTEIGQGSQLIEEGHRSFLKGLMTFLGGRSSEAVGTGWGNILTVTYGRVQRAMMRPQTPIMPLTSRMMRGSSFAVRTEGLIGFTPHAVGISEDTWAVSQAAHSVTALGGTVKFALSSALWHKMRETWSHAEWMAAFPRWSGGYLQMQHDPLMQQINDFGPASVFAKEIRNNSGRNFLSAPFALGNALLLPLAIILDVTPFIEILMLLWNFGFIMNQVLTLHGLNAYLEGSGFHRLPALIGALVGGLGAATVPALRPVAPALAILGALYGGFVVGLNRWLVTRLRDIILFGPQLVLHALGQVMRQSIEFVASGAAATDASSVNIAFRTTAGPREDRPLDRYPHFINLRTILWCVGVPAVILNLIALSNLDMFNVLLLLPSLLFSVSLVLGPHLMCPQPGRHAGARVLLPKALGWCGALAFYMAVSLLIARGGGAQVIGVLLLIAMLASIGWFGGRYFTYHWRWARQEKGLKRLLRAEGVTETALTALGSRLMALGGDAERTETALLHAGVSADGCRTVIPWLRDRLFPLLREPASPPRNPGRLRSIFGRTLVLALFVLLWFFIVPVPGLFVFSAGAYKTSMSLKAILTGLSAAVATAIAGYGLGRGVQWMDRTRPDGLLPRTRAAYLELQRLLDTSDQMSPEQTSRLLALFTDLKTYVDQRSDAYAWRVLKQIEFAFRANSNAHR